MVKRPNSFKEPLPTKKPKHNLADEEILSDEAEDDNLENQDEFFEPEESPEEKRIRLSKELIKQAEEASGNNKEEVENILNQTALDTKGRLTIEIADNLNDHYEASFAKGHLLGVTCIALMPDNKKCISGSKDCCLIIWNLETMQKEHIIKGFRHDRKYGGHFDEIMCVAVSDDSKYIASAGKDRIVRIWDGQTYTSVENFKGHRDTVNAMKFCPNSHILFTAASDRCVKVWNLDDMVFMDTLYGHQSFIFDIDTYPGEKAITCSYDLSVRLWKTLEESQFVYNGHTQSIDCAKIINADHFVTGSQDGSIGLWKTGRKKPEKYFKDLHGGKWITSLAVLKRSDLLASGSSDGWIRLYKVSEGEIELKASVEAFGYITSLDFSKDGKYLVAGVSPDHRFGRWTETIKVKPGILIIDLDLSETRQAFINQFQNKVNFDNI
ncbi:unnamed protein product [Blepharisma stoltei]|uniref:Uncharacterized protein n=1 Tax=Blepharisma stoltei TaxID=1481888 RepID=A0AAU9IGK1_9CILI|nr:unnamed protein product [Blepharisma stoltei]